MHKAVLAAVVAAALFAPAVAQQPNQQMNNGPAPSGQEMQAPPRPAPGSPQAMAGRAIAPELLNAHQIRDIQQALEARGVRSIRVDGRWGADIEAAIMNFQKTENLISQNGELDPLTLMALGLNPLSFGLSGASETTGQAARDGAAAREQMQEVPELPLREQPVREREQR